MRRLVPIWCALLALLAPTPLTHAQDSEPAFKDVDALLDALETAEQDLRALWCEVVYDRRFVLQGDRQIRIGSLDFVRTPPDGDGPARRAFAIDFSHLIVGEDMREERQSWSFKDRWLVERRYEERRFTKRELAPAGEHVDPLRLGSGPMPLPIGQRKADILARYTPELAPWDEGFDDTDDSERAYRAHAQGCAQLRLTPRADIQNPDEKFRAIRLWYRQTDEGLIPVLSRTVDRSGDIVFVQLVGVRFAATLPEGHVISIENPPPGSGWDVQIERGRWDDNLQDVRIGAAPRDVGVHAIAFAQPAGDGSGPEGRDVLGPSSAMNARPERDPAPVRAPDISPDVLRATEARYLDDDQRAERRLFHGLWTNDDLDRPALGAKAALMLGVWDHPWFDEPDTDPLDRAEAMLRRGDVADALAIVRQHESVRARRLAGEALEVLGRFDEAREVLGALRTELEAGVLTEAPDRLEGARATALYARISGENAEAYQNLLRSLTDTHQRVDRLYWPAIVEEARLLESKGNARQAIEAVQQALSMTTASADAWALLGIRFVRGFASDNALGVADRLDALERRVGARDAHSAIGDLIAARMYLRLNDPELAERRVERVLARYPRHREALALRCAISATRYAYATLEEQLSAFDRLSPGHPLALFEAGSALSERRQYEQAAVYLNRTIERLPTWAEPYVELGLMEVQAARDMIARDVLRRAIELDPFHTRAKNSLALVEGLLGEFATLESEHFIVRYKPGVDEILAREMIVDLEAMHDVVAEAMGHTPVRKTLVELMPDHAWFSVRITGMPQIHTVAAATGPIIAMEAPRIGKGHTGVYNWLRVARHEYTHTVTLDRTSNRIPLWHTEAAAVEMELAPRDYNTVRLLAGSLAYGDLFRLEDINLGFIRPEKPSDRSLAYAQANWMWRFIAQTWGADANLEMMDRFASGQRVPRVLDEMFGITPDDFMERFEAWAYEDARTWGVFPEPSLRALRLEETQADEVLGPAVQAELRRFVRDLSRASVDERPVDLPDPKLIDVSPDVVDFWGEIYPDHPDVLELRVERALSEALGNALEEHIPLLERYAEARPTDPLPHRHLARLYLSSDDPNRAIPHLAYLDEREVYSPAYAAALARRYASQGRFEEAMASALRAIRIAPYDGDHRELAATVALRMRDFSTARHQLEALIVLEPMIEQHKKRLEALGRLEDGA